MILEGFNFLNRKEHIIAAVGTFLFHLFAVIILISLSSGKTVKIKSKPPVMPVSIIETAPQKIISTAPNPKKINSFTPQKHKIVKSVKKFKTLKKYGSNPIKNSTNKQPEITDKTPDVDCSMFDEAACSPCLAEPELCNKCCASKQQVKAEQASTSNAMPGCKNPPCKKDPCTPSAVSEMANSFCPKVRRSIYSRLGRITLSGVKQGTYLSSRIAVTVSATGKLSLAGVLRSSNNTMFDTAVSKAVSRASAVLPPSRLSACVASRGCVFNVTIGSKSVKTTNKIIKLKKTEPEQNNNLNKNTKSPKNTGEKTQKSIKSNKTKSIKSKSNRGNKK